MKTRLTVLVGAVVGPLIGFSVLFTVPVRNSIFWPLFYPAEACQIYLGDAFFPNNGGPGMFGPHFGERILLAYIVWALYFAVIGLASALLIRYFLGDKRNDKRGHSTLISRRTNDREVANQDSGAT
jgi:ABC-type Na+ efflux pump permease subunit